MTPRNLTLRVRQALKQDVNRGIARITGNVVRQLSAEIGGSLQIVGGKATVVIAAQDTSLDSDDSLIRLDPLSRRNSQSSLGDPVQVSKCTTNAAASLGVSYNSGSSGEIQLETSVATVVKSGLIGRALLAGDVVMVPGLTLPGGPIELLIVSTEPSGPVVVGAETRIDLLTSGGPAKPAKRLGRAVHYEDLGGVGDLLPRLREVAELPLRHPEIFAKLKISPPRGVLLYGPPGTGKTQLALAVATESDAEFYSISGPELVSSELGVPEAKLREVFEKAQASAPSLIFLDEIDSIAPRRDDPGVGDVQRRIVAQLLTLMDGPTSRGNVVVLAATNRPESIDTALRRSGRFDRELFVGLPNSDGRREILELLLRPHTSALPEKEREKLLTFLTVHTDGYGASDLAALVKEAGMCSIRRWARSPGVQLDSGIRVSEELLSRLGFGFDDFVEALLTVVPSGRKGSQYAGLR